MSRNACLAVGSATTPLGQNSVTATLAERWDGKQWTIQPTPNPPLGTEFNPFAGSELNGVSCASRNACTAVGDSGGESVPLVEVWNGQRWSIQKTPRLRNVDVTALRAVSCTSARSCVAVGFTENANEYSQKALIERSQGARWSIMAAPNPRSIFRSGELDAVSCASRNACTAAGSVVERWDGSRWSIERAPTPGNRHFTSVSCPAVTVCTAIGNGEDDNENLIVFVERRTSKMTRRSWPPLTGECSFGLPPAFSSRTPGAESTRRSSGRRATPPEGPASLWEAKQQHRSSRLRACSDSTVGPFS